MIRLVICGQGHHLSYLVQTKRSVPQTEQSVVPDLVITIRKNMKQETPDKLLDFQYHLLSFVIVLIIFPVEGDGLTIIVLNAVVGDSDTMGITAKIAQNLNIGLEGLFAL